MPEFMLDTDTVSWALRGQGAVSARVLEHRPSQLCISSITLAELRFGADAKKSRKLHRLIATFIRSVGVLPFDQAAADRFGPIASALAKRGEPIGTFDTLIPAHALSLWPDPGHEQHEALSAGRRTQAGELGLNTKAAEQGAAPDRRDGIVSAGGERSRETAKNISVASCESVPRSRGDSRSATVRHRQCPRDHRRP